MSVSAAAVRTLPSGLAERLALAADLFAEHGLEATRVDEVARITGIPRATLYYYFPGKEHILAHLLSSTLDDMAERIESAAAVPGPGRERLERVLREHLAFTASHGATYRLLFTELGRAASLVDIARGVDRAIRAPLRAVLQAGVDDGSLHVLDVHAAASVVHGAVLVSGLEQLLAPSDRTTDRTDAILQVVFEGLGKERLDRRAEEEDHGH